MTQKFIAKDIQFLRTAPDAPALSAPKVYYSDLIAQPTTEFTGFCRRLAKVCENKKTFLTAAIQVDPDAAPEIREKTRDIFDACFHSILERSGGYKERGIWECLDSMTALMAFWDFNTAKEGRKVLDLLNEKITKGLDTGLIMGTAAFPFHDVDRTDMPGCALKALDHAAFFGPGHTIEFDALSLNISGDRRFQLNDTDGAISEYEKGLAMEPCNINLINSLGVAHGVDQDLTKAMEYFEKASRINPEEAMVIHNIALIHRINDNTDSALAYLKKAHAIDPDVFEIELLLGHLLFRENKFNQAMDHLDAAIRLKPESGTAFRIKGQISMEKEDASGAAAHFNQAVKLNPNDPEALSGYARAMALQKKNLPIALSFAKKSLALDPGNETYRQRLEEIEDIHDLVQEKNQKKSIKSA